MYHGKNSPTNFEGEKAREREERREYLFLGRRQRTLKAQAIYTRRHNCVLYHLKPEEEEEEGASRQASDKSPCLVQSETSPNSLKKGLLFLTCGPYSYLSM
jgi:hypothetical protein